MTREEEGLEEKLRRVTSKRSAEEAQAAQLRYQESSRRRLLRIVQKKVTTSFIGALAKVETHVGARLWGHGLPEEACSPEQLAWREVWDRCRTEILNNGNAQLRAVESELLQYTVNWDRYSMHIPASGAA